MVRTDYDIIIAHLGIIKVKIEKSKGASFIKTLPIYTNAVALSATMQTIAITSIKNCGKIEAKNKGGLYVFHRNIICKIPVANCRYFFILR